MPYKVSMNEEWCKGCYLCKNFCPKNVFDISGRINAKGYVITQAVRQNDCTGCNLCAIHCPDLVITIEKEEE